MTNTDQKQKNSLLQKTFLCTYVVLFMVAVFHIRENMNAWQVIQIGFILTAIFLKISNKCKLSFLPEPILFSLPILWTVSVFPSIQAWLEKNGLLAVITLSMAIIVLRKNQLSKRIDYSLVAGISLSVAFIFLFACSLRFFFPMFESFLLIKMMENTLIFVGIIFSGLCATYSFEN